MTEPWRVIITRPEAQARSWAEQLEMQGFHTEHHCLLEIRPLTEPAQERDIQNRVMDFDLYHKAIFVSQNAVHYAMEWLDRYWPQLPLGVEYYAVGATTAQMLRDYGLRVEDLAQTETGSMTSESLLQAPGLQHVAEERIIIFRGLGGRGHMGEVLQARGARVDYCELYERCLPADATAQWQTLLQDEISWSHYENVIALHSGESLHYLLVVLEQLHRLPQQLHNTRLLVPSERIRELAIEKGFRHILVAQNATDAAMTQALMTAVSSER